MTGAADIPVELIRRIRDELPFQSLMTGYGLTEAGNVTLSRPGDSSEDVATTAGVPCEDVEGHLRGYTGPSVGRWIPSADVSSVLRGLFSWKGLPVFCPWWQSHCCFGS